MRLPPFYNHLIIIIIIITFYQRSLYNQLLQEAPVENFGERRVNLLKAQVYQLERQVRAGNETLHSSHYASPHCHCQMLLLSQALSSRSSLVTEVQVLADQLSCKLR